MTVRELFWHYRHSLSEAVVGRAEYALLKIMGRLALAQPLSAVSRRSNIPRLLKYLGLNGEGAELGVFKAEYSYELLAYSRLRKLYAIDRWAGDRGHGDAQMEEARRRLAPFGDRSTLIRSTFDEAVTKFADESLEFVYVDGYAGDGNQDGATIAQWWPKVRPGGLFAGHDYHARYPRNIQAIDSFVRRHGVAMHLTMKDTFPSWMVIKPV